MQIEMLLQHGWACGSGVWAGWRERSAGSLDRGYFGKPKAGTFGEHTQTRVLVTHSLGLHLASRETLARADAVVIISGFLHFHPEQPAARRRSQKVIAAMLDRLQVEPYAVLSDFWRNSGLPVAGSADADQSRLLADLRLLDASYFDARLLAGKRVLVIHGAKDTIVPRFLGAQLAAAVPGAGFSIIADGGHALPVTHASQCLELIATLLEQRPFRGEALAVHESTPVHVCSSNPETL